MLKTEDSELEARTRVVRENSTLVWQTSGRRKTHNAPERWCWTLVQNAGGEQMEKWMSVALTDGQLEYENINSTLVRRASRRIPCGLSQFYGRLSRAQNKKKGIYGKRHVNTFCQRAVVCQVPFSCNQEDAFRIAYENTMRHRTRRPQGISRWTCPGVDAVFMMSTFYAD